MAKTGEKYIKVYDWARKLDIRTSAELLVYSLVYGVNSSLKKPFDANIAYVADRALVTRQGAYKIIEQLVRRGLLERTPAGLVACKLSLQIDVNQVDTKKGTRVNSVDKVVNSVDKKVNSVDGADIINNNKNIIQRRQYIPTLNEIVYFLNQQHVENPDNTAADFFQEYNNNGWRTKNGEAIANWKQFLIKAWLPSRPAPRRYRSVTLEQLKNELR